ncbi:hypothetical protein GRJ2_000258900 [Grus japonensis]|uniref:Uncharacterized protein n=1 Tax=Grus japonensis TaxID=30415 RepID=A0ABC9VYH6_GRUJA
MMPYLPDDAEPARNAAASANDRCSRGKENNEANREGKGWLWPYLLWACAAHAVVGRDVLFNNVDSS